MDDASSDSDSDDDISSIFEEEDSMYFPNERERRLYMSAQRRLALEFASGADDDTDDDNDTDDEQQAFLSISLLAPAPVSPAVNEMNPVVNNDEQPVEFPAIQERAPSPEPAPPPALQPVDNRHLSPAPLAPRTPEPNFSAQFDRILSANVRDGNRLLELLEPRHRLVLAVPVAPASHPPQPLTAIRDAIPFTLARPTFESRQRVSTTTARGSDHAPEFHRRISATPSTHQPSAPAQQRPRQSSAPARAASSPGAPSQFIMAAPRVAPGHANGDQPLPAQRLLLIPHPHRAPAPSVVVAKPPRFITIPTPLTPAPPAPPTSPLTINAACIICFDNISNTVFLPCRHLVICNTCAETGWESGGKGEKCPVCRSAVEEKVVVFRG